MSTNEPNLLKVRSKLDIETDDEHLNPNKLSKKPPLNKEKQRQAALLTNQYKPSSGQQTNAKPTLQGWLYKKKESLSRRQLHSSSLTTLTTGGLIKWKDYWSVLVKDYIAFYKHQDDKIPKDFLLLKDFSIFSSQHKNGFVLYDQIKQSQHEFYAHSLEEYKLWHQSLLDLRSRRLNEPTNASPISSSSSSSIAIPNSRNPNDTSRSLPNNLSSNRKHQSNVLSTIIDSHHDLMSSSKNLSSSLSQQQQQQNLMFSSRESSPGIANGQKMSRENSPVLIYRWFLFFKNFFCLTWTGDN
jgi:hypothetical protein